MLLQLYSDKTISPGGSYQRLTPTLAEYLRGSVDADIDRFRDVMIADRTVLWLHEFLSNEYEARHEEQAGEKLHLLHNATDQTIERIDVTDEKAHDSTLFKTGPWLENHLVLFDFAYFKYRRFARIDENGGYFVSRVKQNANSVITDELREWRGPRHSLTVEASPNCSRRFRPEVHRCRGRSRVQTRTITGRGRWIRSGFASLASATRTPTTTICT